MNMKSVKMYLTHLLAWAAIVYFCLSVYHAILLKLNEGTNLVDGFFMMLTLGWLIMPLSFVPGIEQISYGSADLYIYRIFFGIWIIGSLILSGFTYAWNSRNAVYP